MSLHFKAHLLKTSNYKGGRSVSEVAANGQKIHKLSSNENPLGASPKAVEAMQAYVSGLYEYPDRTDARLRAALQEFYANKMTANQFFTTNSGLENIQLITAAFLEEGTEAILSNPAFEAYQMFVEKMNADFVDVPLKGDNFELDVEGILSAINERTRLIYLTNPNNPTGTYIPKSKIDALIDNLPDHVIVVMDEVYYQYVDAPDYVRAYEYVLAGKNVIAVNSFSKAYGLAGIRVGYSYSTPVIAEYLQQMRRPFMLNTIAMEGAIAALQDEEFIQRTQELVKTEKPFLYENLDRLGIKYWPTQANFILIKPEMDPQLFEDKMLEEGVMVRNATGYGAKDCFRVTIGTRAANEAYVKGLEKVL